MIIIKYIIFINYFRGNGIGAEGAIAIASNFKHLNSLVNFNLNLW
jgi:hypothetical protein